MGIFEIRFEKLKKETAFSKGEAVFLMQTVDFFGESIYNKNKRKILKNRRKYETKEKNDCADCA